MSSSLDSQVKGFKNYVKRLSDYKSAINLLGWDARTKLPKKGVDARSQVLGTLSTEHFTMMTSDEMEGYLDALSSHLEELDRVTRKTYEECKKDFDKSRKIPADRFEAYIVLSNTAQAVWQDARTNNDFAAFAPYLSQIVEFQKEFIGYWGYEDHPYNTLLDSFEPGMTVKALDALFSSLRKETVQLLQKVTQSEPIDDSLLFRFYDAGKQRAFCVRLLEQIGYDFDAGRLDESAHPFATGIARGDVRITTRFLPNFLSTSLFGCIHESGHAMYEQSLSMDLVNTPLHEGASMGIHESQSRFWENIVGRSYAFWQRFYGDLQAVFKEELADVTLDQFYRAINVAKPSLIRTEADELTYNLHIMIRYEVEKGLIDGTLSVNDLPEIWRTKMHDYLGVVPDSDADGVLQDIHWSSGDFGYFPSYSLGNIYAAQFANSLEKDVPTFYDLIANGEFAPIRRWLHDHIHQYGKLLTPNEILLKATGEPSNAQYLVSYLTKKYSSLYGF